MLYYWRVYYTLLKFLVVPPIVWSFTLWYPNCTTLYIPLASTQDLQVKVCSVYRGFWLQANTSNKQTEVSCFVPTLIMIEYLKYDRKLDLIIGVVVYCVCLMQFLLLLQPSLCIVHWGPFARKLWNWSIQLYMLLLLC